MASCFKCAVVDAVSGDADPIGLCVTCNSLACVEHGTRLQKIPAFKCVLCVTSDLLNSAGLIIHESYGRPPSGGRGGDVATAGPAAPRGGGDGGAVRVVESHAELEMSPATRRMAEASAGHRAWAARIADRLVDRVRQLGDPGELGDAVAEIAVTSDPVTLATLTRDGAEVAGEVTAAEAAGELDRDLLADAIGVAAWAIGEPAGAEMAVGRINLLPDARLRFLMRVAARYFVEVGAGGA